MENYKRLTTTNSIKLKSIIPTGIVNIDDLIRLGKSINVDLTRVQASNFALVHLYQISRGRYSLVKDVDTVGSFDRENDITSYVNIQFALTVLKAAKIYHVTRIEQTEIF